MSAATEKQAFRMFLHPGMADAYRQRHDAIWPELLDLLRQTGVEDYSIYLDAQHHVLFGVWRCRPDHTLVQLPTHPLMQRWWQHMKDLMRCHPDGSPVVEPLPCVFHMD